MGDVLGMYLNGLERYEFEEVRSAINSHVCDSTVGQHFPKIADIVRQIEKRNPNSLPRSAEAWALCYRMFDERETVVITGEMRDAWALAYPVLEAGDEVGAMTAFREAYDRLTAKYPPPKWEVQRGTDPLQRIDAITRAVNEGKLTPNHLDLPLKQLPPQTAGITGLLEAANRSTGNENALRLGIGSDQPKKTSHGDVLEKLAELREMLEGNNENALASKRKADREHAERRKQEQIARLDEYKRNIEKSVKAA